MGGEDWEGVREWREKVRNYNVAASKKVLDKFGIKYQNTATDNVVELVDYEKTFMSLKRKNSMFKVKINGVWGNYSKDKLLEMLSVKDMKKFKIKKKKI